MNRIRWAALVIASLWIAAAAPAGAALLMSDTFSKPDGALLGTTPDIGGSWTITGTSVVNPIAISSGAVPLTTTGQDAFAAFTAPAATTAGSKLVTEATINVSAAQATGDYFSHLMNPAASNTTAFFQRLFVRLSWLAVQVESAGLIL